MAHFYGLLQGNRGQASRLGTKASGLSVTAASWSGAVDVDLYERDGVDYARISLKTWHGRGVRRDLYDGPVSGERPPQPDYAKVVHSLPSAKATA